jgi:hypothetical protein
MQMKESDTRPYGNGHQNRRKSGSTAAMNHRIEDNREAEPSFRGTKTR